MKATFYDDKNLLTSLSKLFLVKAKQNALHYIKVINELFHSHIPTGMKVKSAILFSMVRTTLSRPLAKKVPELVRTLYERKEKEENSMVSMYMNVKSNQ